MVMTVINFLKNCLFEPLCMPESILGTEDATKTKHTKDENNAKSNNVLAVWRDHSMHGTLLTVC